MKIVLLFATAICLVFAGCSKTGSQADADHGSASQDDAPIATSANPGQGHPDHGPHRGELIELGNEDYHAELVHGDDQLSVYVLDASATRAVAIEETQLALSLKHDGDVKTFDLVAAPKPGDPDPRSSRFVSADPVLHEWLDHGAEGAVIVQIDGKSYTGKVSHDHAHGGHGH